MMNMKLKLLPALVAAMCAGCGGGGEPSGQTVSTNALPASVSIRCLDQNQNWQCDDGDTAITTLATGQALLAPSSVSSRYTLEETRDSSNLRTVLRISELGGNTATALSTLRSRLAALGKTTLQIDAVVTALTSAHGAALEALLSAGFTAAQQSHPMALEALNAYSLAVYEQRIAGANVPAFVAAIQAATTEAAWASAPGDERRQLSARSSVVLNNSESNRLYLFDASHTAVSSQEIDLIPPVAPALASYPKLLRQSVAWLGKAVSVFVDTASAATGLAGAPTTGSPVVLQPGKGIAGIQLVGAGETAFVLLNMLSGAYTQGECLSTSDGHEGLFKISLTETAAVRQLSQSPACVHSGFSLIASDASGHQLAAWDATAQRLWLLNGQTMARQASLDLKFEASKPPQALVLTPGGRYMAAAGYGRVALIDIEQGRVVAQLTGSWGNVSQIAFANGGRRLLIASDNLVHTVALDDSLQLISSTAKTVAGAGETLRGLAITADGDSYVAVSDTTAYWHGLSGTALTSKALPLGLSVQQATLAGQHLVLLARGQQDQQFKLMRLSLNTPTF